MAQSGISAKEEEEEARTLENKRSLAVTFGRNFCSFLCVFKLVLVKLEVQLQVHPCN